MTEQNKNYTVNVVNSQADRDQAQRILNNGNTSSGTSADGDGTNSGNGEGGDGTGTDGDNTSENVKQNDPEKNKKLAEITMSEQLRETYQLTVKIPRILKGLHTNQFFFMEVTDDFYETNYPTLIEKVANERFGRYAGFQKGRFFVDKVTEKGGIDGWGMEVTLNPIPPSLATYSKLQQEATKALIQAINDESKYNQGGADTSGMGGLTTITGEDCSETFGISTRSYDITQTANHIIGNSSANYALDTANMDGKTAIMDIYNRFRYSSYYDNRTCPQKMWSTGTISGNCADISRLVMCVGQVHGMTVGIHHMSGHYYNLIDVGGTAYRFDCCCKSSGSYRGEITNNLPMRGGPWS